MLRRIDVNIIRVVDQQNEDNQENCKCYIEFTPINLMDINLF